MIYRINVSGELNFYVKSGTPPSFNELSELIEKTPTLKIPNLPFSLTQAMSIQHEPQVITELPENAEIDCYPLNYKYPELCEFINLNNVDIYEVSSEEV
jgi:hypothetical protein